jgi:hypothetical protein
LTILAHNPRNFILTCSSPIPKYGERTPGAILTIVYHDLTEKSIGGRPKIMPKAKKPKANKGKRYQKQLSLYGQDETDVLRKMLSTPPQKQAGTVKEKKAK